MKSNIQGSTVLSFVLLGLMSAAPAMAQFEPKSPANKYRKLIGESIATNADQEATSKIKSSYDRFLNSPQVQSLRNQNFVAWEEMGYSGADYADKAGYAKKFEDRVMELVSENQRRFGAQSTTVIILGGSYDGFGRGYKVIDQLRKSGRVQNVAVWGLVSEAAVEEHIKGLNAVDKDGNPSPYDVIASEQDLLLLLPTSKDDPWATRENATASDKTPRILRDLAQFPTAKEIGLEAWEGGPIALEQAIEYVMDAHTTAKPGILKLMLDAGFEPGKLAKDKGPKAARQMAKILQENPQLVPASLQVTVRNSLEPTVTDYTVEQFFKTELGKVYVDARAKGKLYAKKFSEKLAELETAGADDADKAIAKSAMLTYQSWENLAATLAKVADRFEQQSDTPKDVAAKLKEIVLKAAHCPETWENL